MAAIDRLLIVDEEQDVSRLIEIPARALGYEVLSINDSDQFEKAFEQIKPTIVFLDIAMPGRDGMELIGHLAAGNYPGKVVLMSGSDPAYIEMSATVTKTRGLILGGTLTKPFRKDVVTALLAGLIGGPVAQPRVAELLHYCVQSRAETGPMQTFWVLADSAEAARALVALNVPGASNARDDTVFDCLEDDTKTPPAGLFFSDRGAPIAIRILA